MIPAGNTLDLNVPGVIPAGINLIAPGRSQRSKYTTLKYIFVPRVNPDGINLSDVLLNWGSMIPLELKRPNEMSS